MKSNIQRALEIVKGKLATGAGFFGHEVELVEKALEEAVKAEKDCAEKHKKEV
jgi:hypothetical protein